MGDIGIPWLVNTDGHNEGIIRRIDRCDRHKLLELAFVTQDG